MQYKTLANTYLAQNSGEWIIEYNISDDLKTFTASIFFQ